MLTYDYVLPAELTGFARQYVSEMERNRFVLSAFLPNRMQDEIEFAITTGQFRDEDAAYVRAWDTESPLGSRQGLKRLFGELAPISKRKRLGEEERLRRRKLERGLDPVVMEAIYNDTANLARAVAARIELLRGEVIFNAANVINENGVQQTVTWGRTGSHTVTAGTLWSDHAASTPVADLRAWTTTYIATNGVAPGGFMTSVDVVNHLLLNSSLRAFASTTSGTPSMISVDTMQAVLQAFGLPPIITYDVNVRVGGTLTRVTPANKGVLLPPAGIDLGYTAYGTTAEALELVDAQQLALDDAAGLVATQAKTVQPVSLTTEVTGIALPLLPNPNLTLCATVA